MNTPPTVEAFITSATLEVRFMPGIDPELGSRIAQAMLAEVKATGSPGAHAYVIAREDELSVSIEHVEDVTLTPAGYAVVLGRLREVAEKIARGG